MSSRYVFFFIGVMVAGLAGCSSHHHGSYGQGKGDYYWSKASRDVSGLVEQHVKNPDTVKQVNVVMGEMITEIKSAREQHRQSHRALYRFNSSDSAVHSSAVNSAFILKRSPNFFAAERIRLLFSSSKIFVNSSDVAA